MRKLAAAARQLGLKFVLGSDGADEVLGGYVHFGLNRTDRFIDAYVSDPSGADAMRLPGWILPRTDANAMAHGIEARVPFLDPDVLSTMANIPAAELDVVMSPKAALRRAVGPFMPPMVARRKKRAFNTSNDWLWSDSAVRDLIYTTANDPFEPGMVRRLFDQVTQDRQRSHPGLQQGLRTQTLVGVITTRLLSQTVWTDLLGGNFAHAHAQVDVLP